MTTTNDSTQAQIEGLATLLVLDDEIKRLTTLRELGFFATNETHRLIPYHTAYLWEKKEFLGLQLIAQSGTAEIDSHAPTNQWLKEKIQFIISGTYGKQLHQFSAAELEPNTQDILSVWPESLPHHMLWCPFLNKSNQLSGGLTIFRDTAFGEAEIRMLRWLIASYQYTWNVLVQPKKNVRWDKLKEKPYFFALIIAALTFLFFPIHLSVLGNATVVPKDPFLINAPMQGVIHQFAVNPGAVVKAGQLLLTMDTTDLLATAEIDQRDYLLTEAKLRTSVSQAFTDKDRRAEVPILQAQLAIDKAHLEYTQTLLKKTQITSPIDGVIIFDSKEDWVSQPVQTGERILMVADPAKVKLRITLPVTDIIRLKVNDEGDFFLYGQLSSIPIQLTSLGYNAKLLPNKTLAYQLEAEIISTTPNRPPQIGAQGTVKLYGQRVPLIYYLIRRPLQAIRQKIGM